MRKGFTKNSGFTLVELLVVVAIIAILSVIGLTIFSGAQANARDARRRADIDAISKALETNKGVATVYYSQLAITQFSGGVIPQDTTDAKYCIKTAADGIVPDNPTAWAVIDACPTTDWNQVSASGFTSVNAWKVCARLDTSTATVLKVYCKPSSQ